MSATDAAEWLVRNYAAREQMGGPKAPEVTDDNRRCLNTLAALTVPSGLYNLPTPGPVLDAIELWSNGGVSVILRGEFSTYDSDRLTALVVAAHWDHVRVSLSPWLYHQDEPRARLLAEHLTHEYGYQVEWDALTTPLIEVTLHPRKPDAEGRADHHQFTEAHRRDKARDDAERIARENDMDGAA